ncbi:MAG TPA: zinc-dependent alcohol dehydrogenase [Actinomycetales bacterium]|nr:zinc-dependent alcohol dehydrogenase [Actinomycetales bacterium]
MRALTWQGKGNVRVEDVPDPRIETPTDAIIRITSTAICGSDLHLFDVLGPFLRPGDVLGHEPMGVVEEVGAEVQHIAPGDRVVVPFNISCGSCWMCNRGLFAQCETTQVREKGTGARLFGYTSLYGSVPGGQAEYLRVPQAHFGPVKVPDNLPDDRFLYLSDILPTAWQGVQYADVEPGTSVAVLGLGPVGQLTARVARHFGAEHVIGVDLVPERLQQAKAHGVETIDVKRVDDTVDALLDATGGRGPDSVIDCVGMEAHGAPAAQIAQAAVNVLPSALSAPMTERFGVDRLTAVHTAVRAVRRGGTVSLVGVYGGQVDPMPMMAMFDRGIAVRMGQCHVRRWTDQLLESLTESDEFGVDELATHHLPLEEAPAAYEMFRDKRDGCMKVVLQP